MIEWMQLMGSVLRGEDNMNFNSQIECEAAFLYLNSGKSRDLCGFSGHTNCSCRNKQESFLYLQMTLTLGALKWSINFELLKWIIRIFLHVILRKLEASCSIMDTWDMACATWRTCMVKGKKSPVNILWVILQWCLVLLQLINVTFLFPCSMVSEFYWVSAFLFPSTGKKSAGVIFIVKKSGSCCRVCSLSTRLEMYSCFICKG